MKPDHAPIRCPWSYAFTVSALLHVGVGMMTLVAERLGTGPTAPPAPAFRSGQTAAARGPVSVSVAAVRDAPAEEPAPARKQAPEGSAERPREEGADAVAPRPAVRRAEPARPEGPSARRMAQRAIARMQQMLSAASRSRQVGEAHRSGPVDAGKGRPRPAEEDAPALPAASEAATARASAPAPGADDRAEPADAQSAASGEPGVVTEAEPRSGITPAYPPASIRRGEQGLVVVEARVRADGRVWRARVAESSGYAALDRAAVQAVREVRFGPARRAGRAVASRVRVPIRFVLRPVGGTRP